MELVLGNPQAKDIFFIYVAFPLGKMMATSRNSETSKYWAFTILSG
jgi:hypothetical protein